MNTLVLLLQNTDVNQKLKEAPDSGYAIGVFIGTILPFLVLIVIAYTIYRSRKNRLKDN